MSQLIHKLSVQNDFVAGEDRVITSIFVQTDNIKEAEFVKFNNPFTVEDLIKGLRNLANHLENKYDNS